MDKVGSRVEKTPVPIICPIFKKTIVNQRTLYPSGDSCSTGAPVASWKVGSDPFPPCSPTNARLPTLRTLESLDGDETRTGSSFSESWAAAMVDRWCTSPVGRWRQLWLRRRWRLFGCSRHSSFISSFNLSRRGQNDRTISHADDAINRGGGELVLRTS